MHSPCLKGVCPVTRSSSSSFSDDRHKRPPSLYIGKHHEPVTGIQQVPFSPTDYPDGQGRCGMPGKRKTRRRKPDGRHPTPREA